MAERDVDPLLLDLASVFTAAQVNCFVARFATCSSRSDARLSRRRRDRRAPHESITLVFAQKLRPSVFALVFSRRQSAASSSATFYGCVSYLACLPGVRSCCRRSVRFVQHRVSSRRIATVLTPANQLIKGASVTPPNAHPFAALSVINIDNMAAFCDVTLTRSFVAKRGRLLTGSTS